MACYSLSLECWRHRTIGRNSESMFSPPDISLQTASSNTLAGLSKGVDHREPSSTPVFSSETLRGGVYLMSRYGVGVLVSLGNMLVMTRWIGPHSYGLFVTAIGLVAFLSTLARAGVDIYLVRREAAPDEHMYH